MTDWNWVATDADGEQFLYEDEPQRCYDDFFDVNGGSVWESPLRFDCPPMHKRRIVVIGIERGGSAIKPTSPAIDCRKPVVKWKQVLGFQLVELNGWSLIVYPILGGNRWACGLAHLTHPEHAAVAETTEDAKAAAIAYALSH